MKTPIKKNHVLAAFAVISCTGLVALSIYKNTIETPSSQLPSQANNIGVKINNSDITGPAEGHTSIWHKAPANKDAQASGRGAKVEELLATRDPANALSAFKLLQECATLPSQRSNAAGLPNDPIYEAARLSALKQIDRLGKECESVNAARLNSRLTILESALVAGVPGAAVAFRTAGPNGAESDLLTRPDDALVAQWHERSLQLLEQAAKRREIDAVGLLAWINNQEHGTSNKLNAVAYSLVQYQIVADAEKLQPTTENQTLRRRLHQALLQQTKELTTDEVATALSIASSIYGSPLSLPSP